MKLPLFSLGLTAILLATPAVASKWDTYFNMATFGAGGGADAGGWFNFECADADSGFSTAGQPYFTLIIGETFAGEKFKLESGVTFFVDDGLSFVLPMSRQPRSTTNLGYDHNPDMLQEMQDFIAALRQGAQVTAWSGQQQLARVTLENSYAALEFIEACIAGED